MAAPRYRPLVAFVVVFHLYDRGTVSRTANRSGAGGLLGAGADGPLDRSETVAATD